MLVIAKNIIVFNELHNFCSKNTFIYFDYMRRKSNRAIVDSSSSISLFKQLEKFKIVIEKACIRKRSAFMPSLICSDTFSSTAFMS